MCALSPFDVLILRTFLLAFCGREGAAVDITYMCECICNPRA